MSEVNTRFRHKPHEVAAVQWRGDNRAEVEAFLATFADRWSFDADLDDPSEHWNGVNFTIPGQGDTWCDQDNWIVVYQPDAHDIDVLEDEDFRRDFEPAASRRSVEDTTEAKA